MILFALVIKKERDMDKRVLEKIRKIVHEKSGISLGENKNVLVTSRLGKRMKLLDITDYSEYLKYLTGENGEDETIKLLDVVSTNVTSFFREGEHFELLRKIVLNWKKNRQSRFKIWSAACSTGEEAYSIAMTLCEMADIYQGNVKILATDLSTDVLGTAKEGIYSKEKTKGISSQMLTKYFNTVRGSDDNDVQANDQIKKMISFYRLNLAEIPYPMSGPFDVVFCRNVMIYFQNDFREKLLREIARLIRPDGYFFTGHSESIINLSDDFKSLGPSVYIKKAG